MFPESAELGESSVPVRLRCALHSAALRSHEGRERGTHKFQLLQVADASWSRWPFPRVGAGRRQLQPRGTQPTAQSSSRLDGASLPGEGTNLHQSSLFPPHRQELLLQFRHPSGRVAQRPQPAPLRTARHSRHRERHPGRCSPQRAPRCHRTELPPRKHGFSGRNEQIHHVKETLPGRPTLNSRPRAAPCPALPWPYLRGPGARCGRPGARSGSRRRRKASPTWARLGGRPETPERGRSGAAGNTRAGGTETPERVRVSRAAGRWWRLSAHPSASPLDNAANQHLVLQSRGARAALQADSREGVAEGRTGRTSRK